MKHNKRYLFTLIFILCLPSVSNSTVLSDQAWTFRVYLNETPIGIHTFELRHEQKQSIMQINAEFDIKFLFISVYQYSHNNQEIWQAGCLKSLSSLTDDNGDKQFVELSTEGPTYSIDTHQGKTTHKQCLRSFSYWNPILLNSPQLINAQTGEITAVKLSFIGEESYQQSKQARHYKLTGESIEIDLWYDNNNRWLALHSQLDSGDQLRYERVEYR